MTPWWHYVVALFAPLFLINGIPHTVSGLTGRRFPTPFVGGPPNLDTPPRNILWGGGNLVLGGVLLWLVSPSLSNLVIVIEMVIVAWGTAYLLARLFATLKAN